MVSEDFIVNFDSIGDQLFLGQVKRLSGHTADPQFLSQITVSHRSVRSFPNFPLLVVNLQSLAIDHEDRYSSSFLLRDIVSSRSGHCLAGEHASSRSS